MAEQNRSEPSQQDMLNKKDGWFRYCRPYLEQLNPRDDLDLVTYVRDMIARAKSFKADTLVMMADDGGCQLYPSDLAPINTHIHGQDLLGMIQQECSQHGLRFGLGFLGAHCNSHIAATRPDWAMRDENGEVYPFYHWHVICLNSPYGRYYVDLIGETLARYPVDYLYVEGEYVRTQGCYCAFCEDGFRAAFGKELRQAAPAERSEFMSAGVTAFQAAVKAATDAVSPETVVVGTSYRGTHNTGCDLATFPAHTDMMAVENQWGVGDLRSLHRAGLDILQLKALSQKPVVGTWWSSHDVDLNFHQRSAAHAKLSFMQTLAYGAAVQPHIQTAFEFERTLLPTLTELFSCVERVRDYLLDAELLPYIAVVDSAPAMGYCNALLEHHLPFDLIAPRDLDRERLAAHQAVIVGETSDLSEKALDDLAAYVEAGGGLVCAGQVSAELAALIGLELDGEIDSGRDELPLYYRFETAAEPWGAWGGRLLSFGFPCARVRPSADFRVEAQIIGLDTDRMHEDHMGIKPYPGSPQGPMMLTRRVANGRVLYLAGDLASIAMPGEVADADVLEVLAKAALWAADVPPPVTTNAPPSVELVTHVKPDRMTLFVLNQTMNQVGDKPLIRYVVPLPDQEIRVKVNAQVRDVTAVSGQPVRYELRDGWLTIGVPKLNEYEVLLVDYTA